MSNLTPHQKTLDSAWGAVEQGAGLALDWLQQVAPKVSEVAGKADSLSRDLYRARNLARSLKRVSGTPLGIGFFGLSQAGKSYLISALAADRNGGLTSELGGETLDFIKHINPVGGGKEATGLVTRFTRLGEPAADSQYPVELRLFREIEIAIILANAWFEDFDPQRREPITADTIAAVLQPFAGRANGDDQPGVSREDVVALWDYLERNYPKAVELLAGEYWPQVLQLAPRLSVSERGQLFSVLWGGIDEMTATYRQLAACLHRLGLADTLFAPLTALVARQPDGELRQTNSIMNVDILSRLGGAADSPLSVRPRVLGELRPAVSVNVAELAALTNELIFRLHNTPANDIVNSVDLLDFPGYRSRQKLSQLSEAAEVGSDGQAGNPVARLLLRGKVAYLFERYTIEQEMNALVMCTSTFKQSEVVSVGPVLKSWIDKTQGSSSQQRGNRKSGLIWALTMCDGFIGNALNGEVQQYPEACDNMLKLTMVERFGNEEWMKAWDSQPFRNTCLVRKPRFKTAFLEFAENGDEIGLARAYEPQMQRLAETFAASDLVRRHVAEPEQAWQAMLAANDGGMQRFSATLEPVTHLDFKLERIQEQLDELLTGLLPRLEEFYEAGGEDERQKKKVIANLIAKPLAAGGHGKAVLGELLAYMALPDEQLRELYLSGDFESAAGEPQEEPGSPAPVEPEYDIFGEPQAQVATPAVSKAPELQSHEHRFARAAFELWVAHLRQLPRRQHVLDLLGLPADAMGLLVKELIITAERLGLPQQLSAALLQRAQSGVRHDALVQRQVLTCQLKLNDFSAWFGHMVEAVEDRPTGLLGSRQPLFSFYQQPLPGRFPDLPVQAHDQAEIFANDWISGVAIHTQNNTGHRKGKEITPEQNEALGRAIKAFNAR